jgi:hypothetical protein
VRKEEKYKYALMFIAEKHSYELRATSYELRATSYELRATSYELREIEKESWKSSRVLRFSTFHFELSIDLSRAGRLPYGT